MLAFLPLYFTKFIIQGEKMKKTEIQKNINILLEDLKKLGNLLFNDLDKVENKTLKVAILAEYMELLNNYNWKPWSKTKLTHIEEINKKVETIDIFILSFVYYIKNKPFIDIKEIVEQIEFFDYLRKENINYNHELDVIENAIFYVGGINDPDLMFRNIVNIMPYQIHSLKELFFFTETKIILSTFRDLNGYREKKYHKSWNGLEDNHYIHIYILPKLLKNEKDLKSFKIKIQQEIEKTYFDLFKEKKLELHSKQIAV
jgi:hypothetical protein